MNSISKIINSYKEVRYLISGVASEVIEYGSFGLLMVLTNALYLSNSISFLLGIISGFIFHKLWSFAGEQRFKTHSQVVAYSLLAAFNFAMINIIVGFFAHTLQVRPALAKLAGMVITAGWSYLAFNWFIFRHNSSK